MKTRPIRLAAMAVGLAVSLSLGTFKTSADVAVSVGVQVNAVAEFHAPLAPHGAWVEFGSYGRCWRPSRVAVGWRPYCDGHWEWTDCGWYWVSDEPWAWATYHYGSWVYESGGWLWVPGIEWAPAWVSWRVGGSHIGWAPIAPRGVVIAPSLFVFVDGPRFTERVQPGTVIVNNTTIINNTREITNVKRETRTIAGRQQQVMVNEGPGAETVQKITGKKLAAAPVQEVDRKTTVPAAVKRRAVDSSTKEAAPTQEKQATPERKQDQPGKSSPTEKSTEKGKTSPQDKPDRAAPTPKQDKPDRTSPTEKPKQPERTPDRTSPAEKQEKPDRPDRTAPAERPDSPKRTPPAEKSDKTSPAERPDRTPPAEKPKQPDRTSPPSQQEKPDRAAPPDRPSGDETRRSPERRQPSSPPQKSPSPDKERNKKERGPGQ